MSTTKEQWAPCVLMEDSPTPCGISASYPKRLPGLFDTCREAMEVAEKLAHQHPKAIGISAILVEVPHGA